MRFIVLACILLASGELYAQEKQTIKGMVVDSHSQQAMIGATVYIASLNRGAQTNEQGEFTIPDVNEGDYVLEVRYIGYSTHKEELSLNSDSKLIELIIPLEASSQLISCPPIIGHSLLSSSQNAAPATKVSKQALLESSGANIIDALAKQPGVSQITTGAGISKPVIRGLGYNRVLIVNDGVRQEGQQWGSEHGVEIDQFGVERIEILKGPASLIYGSDAMAGVIYMNSMPYFTQETKRANFTTNYQSNNKLWAYSANAEGNTNNWLWGARLSGKNAQDYKNKIDGNVDNSSFSDNSLSLMFGQNSDNRLTTIKLSYYRVIPEIPSLEEDEHHEEEEEEHHEDEESHAHFQKVEHFKAVLQNRSIFENGGEIKSTVSFQQNRRKEFEEQDAYGMYLQLNTLIYDTNYETTVGDGWNITTGIGGMYQHSENFGSEYLIPNYNLFDIGAYLLTIKRYEKLSLSGGLRYDFRHVKGTELEKSTEELASSAHQDELGFEAFNSKFTGFSASIGAKYQLLPQLSTNLNLSRAYRAPNVAELGANGNHHGSYSYQMGNAKLKPEQSFQLDWGMEYQSNHLVAWVNLFSNHVNNYIYSHKMPNSIGLDSIIDHYSVFTYSQGNAHLYGGEIYFDFHPHVLHELHFENTLSYTRGKLLNQTDSLTNLPMIPPIRLTSNLRYNFNKLGKAFSNVFVSFGVEHNWGQKHYLKAYNTETATPAYMLLNTSIGGDVKLKERTLCSIYISGENLANKAYQSHLNRLKYAGHNEATEREGYYNMGRNFSFKLIFPLGNS